MSFSCCPPLQPVTCHEPDHKKWLDMVKSEVSDHDCRMIRLIERQYIIRAVMSAGDGFSFVDGRHVEHSNGFQFNISYFSPMTDTWHDWGFNKIKKK